MGYPIKYIENNLVFNHDGETFAYYELFPYNYSFLSGDEKIQVHDHFLQLIAQNKDGKIHASQISTAVSIQWEQQRTNKLVSARLEDAAYESIDEETEGLVSMIGEHQVDYCFFIGFKLLLNEEDVSMKAMGKNIKNSLSSFVRDVNHHLMGDSDSMPHDEIRRFSKMESLLQNKISRRFKIRPLDKNDFGYLIEHLHGQTGMAYDEYDYALPLKKLKKETLVKRYDLIKPTRCLIEENQRYLKIEQEEQTTYVAYFTINSIVGD